MGFETELRSVFGQAYDRGKWLGILNQQLSLEVYSQPLSIEEEKVESLIQLGTVTLDDGMTLGIYEVQTKPETKIHRNRVQMREIVARQCRQSTRDGALAVYLPSSTEEDHGRQWRFSFVSVEHKLDEQGRLITKESSSKRYTYLLGRGAQIRTVIERFSLLDNSSTLADVTDAFAVEPLNKEFYEKLQAWYNRAQTQVTFPNDQNIDHDIHVQTSLIRLITRLLFIWFIREKKLVHSSLFDQTELPKLIRWTVPSSYYKAILQNLFFATLNVEIDKRDFRDKHRFQGKNRDYGDQYRYRYHDMVVDSQEWRGVFEKTPFLNGGLFDSLDRKLDVRNLEDKKQIDSWHKGIRPEKLMIRMEGFSDRTENPLSVPNSLFFNDDEKEPGLIDLLKQYQFTLVESTPIDVEVALDPELLGKVFENLLAEYNPETRDNARKQTGSYYTPRNVVDYIVEEALIAVLIEKVQPEDDDPDFYRDRLRYLFNYAETNDDAEELFTENERESITSKIANIKVIDPAVGSGAFPMAILLKLTLALQRLDPDNTFWEVLQKKRARSRLDEAIDIRDQNERDAELQEISETFERYKDSDFGRKLYLIQNSIFGVDVQPVACQIAKLRFFISLAIEQDVDKQAWNFGIRPLPNLETRFVTADTLLKLEQSVQMGLFHGPIEILKLKLGENRERYFHATTRQVKLECRNVDQQLRNELSSELNSAGLLPPDDAKEIAAWDPYDQNSKADWFDAEYMFGVTDGFDVVVGNPPYIRLQKDVGKGKLGDLYGRSGFETFARTGDVYQLFYEQGCKLLTKSGGVLAYITSNSWLRAKYGKALRHYFTERCTPLRLLEMGKDVFKNAIVDTNILIVRFGNSHETGKAVDIDRLSDKTFPPDDSLWGELRTNEGDPWISLSKIEQSIMDKIEAVGTALKEWDISINYGIKTGCNQAFIIDNKTKERLIREDPKSAELLRPVLRGRDIGRFRANWAGLWLIASFPAMKVNIDDYPAINKHLLSFGQERLEQGGKTLSDGNKTRKKTPHAWYELQDTCAYHGEFKKEKLLWMDMTSRGRFSYSNDEIYCNDKGFMMTGTSLKYLCAVLNSALVTWYMKIIALTTGMGVPQWKKFAVERIPIPSLSATDHELVIEMVDCVLQAKMNDQVADISEVEQAIDRWVYKLYGLTSKEICEVVDY
ncbi:MAG: Eco57I restriction-modification methylase domain-containing protein [Candidatus Poribacteria bacterium]|nr:Eco57I restriction-modification methylase domain-containing protein [Candidatus Poribacteria bacterium]